MSFLMTVFDKMYLVIDKRGNARMFLKSTAV